ncbi:hypothetical protein ADK67_26595 [Saccharothrix sp. NRRL B-16348]|uniref:hypothetical protein n=1 Tax=Saccharothrix sp. NRRL B-16348 TaxID=1415542 RepID=UPI0006AE92BD|nr:hypothetical protein [Saccharothrix sp. NRRL B-16348]KOX21554.1 hypothetical protein ADK67_26595 [Saccharothrix sp. NRRL B-16348]
MGETSGKHVLLVGLRLPDETEESAVSNLSSYLEAKKRQVRAFRATCMLFKPAGNRLLRVIYDNRPLGANADLDAAATDLVPLEEMERAVPKPIGTPRVAANRVSAVLM